MFLIHLNLKRTVVSFSFRSALKHAATESHDRPEESCSSFLESDTTNGDDSEHILRMPLRLHHAKTVGEKS